MNLNLTLPPAALRVIEKMQRFPETILKATAKGLDRGMQRVTSTIIRDRLSGKGPFPVAEHRLGRRSHNLARTTLAIPARIEGRTVVSGIGTNAWYARVHEYGYEGDVQVGQFTRKEPRRDIDKPISVMTIKRKRRTVKERQLSGIAIVKAHTRHMRMPARAPFTTGLREGRGIIRNEISAELIAEWGRPG